MLGPSSYAWSVAPLPARTRAMQAGLKAGVIDRAVGHICGAVPFAGPFAIGHECIAEVIDVGPDVRGVAVGAASQLPARSLPA